MSSLEKLVVFVHIYDGHHIQKAGTCIHWTPSNRDTPTVRSIPSSFKRCPLVRGRIKYIHGTSTSCQIILSSLEVSFGEGVLQERDHSTPKHLTQNVGLISPRIFFIW